MAIESSSHSEPVLSQQFMEKLDQNFQHRRLEDPDYALLYNRADNLYGKAEQFIHDTKTWLMDLRNRSIAYCRNTHL